MEVEITTAQGARSCHLSASTVALGYPAAVTLGARKLAGWGRFCYAAATMVIRAARFRARIQYGDAPQKDVPLTGFIANNTQHVANFVAFRRASFCDGQFDTMEMNAGVFHQTLHNASAISGTGAYQPGSFTRTTSATLQLEAPQSLVVDGEVFPDILRVDVKILPSRLACNGAGSA